MAMSVMFVGGQLDGVRKVLNSFETEDMYRGVGRIRIPVLDTQMLFSADETLPPGPAHFHYEEYEHVAWRNHDGSEVHLMLLIKSPPEHPARAAQRRNWKAELARQEAADQAHFDNNLKTIMGMYRPEDDDGAGNPE